MPWLGTPCRSSLPFTIAEVRRPELADVTCSAMAPSVSAPAPSAEGASHDAGGSALASGPGQPDPAVWLQLGLTNQISTKENKWQGRNPMRWSNAEFDKLLIAADSELDPVKRVAMLIACNDLMVKNQAVIPIVYRPTVSGISNKLSANISGWDSNFYDLADWYVTAST